MACLSDLKCCRQNGHDGRHLYPDQSPVEAHEHVAERAPREGDPWAELRAEVEATNRWYDGDKPVNSVSAWVGFWPPTGWYGGAGFDGDCMEEVAEASGATAGEAATMLVRLMREWRDRTDRERAEEDDPA